MTKENNLMDQCKVDQVEKETPFLIVNRVKELLVEFEKFCFC